MAIPFAGIAELATLLEREKAALPQDVTLLVTLNGDFLSGSEVGERHKGCVSIVCDCVNKRTHTNTSGRMIRLLTGLY